jgi:hypothetical protein
LWQRILWSLHGRMESSDQQPMATGLTSQPVLNSNVFR